jgi:hypothetical protein
MGIVEPTWCEISSLTDRCLGRRITGISDVAVHLWGIFLRFSVAAATGINGGQDRENEQGGVNFHRGDEGRGTEDI